MCEKSCTLGSELSPLVSCECVNSKEIREALYPAWATDQHISEANDAGFKNYKNPNNYLPVCDEEITCGSGFYLNNLACQCFSAAQCGEGCPYDQWPVLTEPCGCSENASDYYDLFPHWATNTKIVQSISDGLTEYSFHKDERPKDWPACTRDSKDVCRFYNELACTCFSEVQCALYCGEGLTLDPRYGCECIGLKEERSLYPSWATQEDIDLSKKLMYEQNTVDPFAPPVTPHLPHNQPGHHLLEKPMHWLECDKATTPPCDLDHHILNELACVCFSMI